MENFKAFRVHNENGGIWTAGFKNYFERTTGGPHV